MASVGEAPSSDAVDMITACDPASRPGTIGEGAVIDEQFNTTDVCIVLPMKEFAPRYHRHYARKINLRYNPAPEAGNDENETVLVRGAG